LWYFSGKKKKITHGAGTNHSKNISINKLFILAIVPELKKSYEMYQDQIGDKYNNSIASWGL